MNGSNAKYIVNTIEGEELGIGKARLIQLADMNDAEIEGQGIIAQSVRDEFNRHFNQKRRRDNYSVIVVATQTDEAGRCDYAAYHLESEGGSLGTQVWRGLFGGEKFWTRAIHFIVSPDMTWGLLSDTIESPLCWRTGSNVFVSCELVCDEVANEMLDIARAVAYPGEYLRWSAELNRQECEAIRAKQGK